jgi:Predicted hydrolases or acyltransferases (alpha/beta hydrolase superfamily)
MLKTLQKSKSPNGIAFFKIGSGHPIIFIHGLGLRAECWFHQIEELKKNHTVYTIDMPGHGKSDLLKDQKVSLKSFVKVLVEFIKIQKIDRPIIVDIHLVR